MLTGSLNATQSLLWCADGSTASSVSSPGLVQLPSASLGTNDDQFQVPKKQVTTVSTVVFIQYQITVWCESAIGVVVIFFVHKIIVYFFSG